MKRYFEIELEYTGTKIFRVDIDRIGSTAEALEYIATNLHRLEQGDNPYSDCVEGTLTAIYLREDK